MIKLAIYGLIALAVAGMVYGAWRAVDGWCNDACVKQTERADKVKGTLDKLKADLAAAQKVQEDEDARKKLEGERVAAIAATAVRQADERVAVAENAARLRLRERDRALRTLADVRRVLDNTGGRSRAGDTAPAAPGTAAGAPDQDTGADPAGRLLACTENLTGTVDTMAVNNANHERALTRVHEWEVFYAGVCKTHGCSP